jgi:hypothetical protein
MATAKKSATKTKAPAKKVAAKKPAAKKVAAKKPAAKKKPAVKKPVAKKVAAKKPVAKKAAAKKPVANKTAAKKPTTSLAPVPHCRKQKKSKSERCRQVVTSSFVKVHLPICEMHASDKKHVLAGAVRNGAAWLRHFCD